MRGNTNIYSFGMKKFRIQQSEYRNRRGDGSLNETWNLKFETKNMLVENTITEKVILL